MDFSAPVPGSFKDSHASLGSATQGRNASEKALWLDEALAQTAATTMHEEVYERFAVVKQDLLDMLQKEFEQEREKATKDIDDVVSFVLGVVKKALQWVETAVSTMATAVVYVSHLVEQVASLEGNYEQHRTGAASFAVRFLNS